jgi:hypothetical protein
MPYPLSLPRGVHPILVALFGADGALEREAMRRRGVI